MQSFIYLRSFLAFTYMLISSIIRVFYFSLFILSLFHLSIYLFILPSSICSIINYLCLQFVTVRALFIYLFINLFIHSFVHYLFIYSFICSFIQSVILPLYNHYFFILSTKPIIIRSFVLYFFIYDIVDRLTNGRVQPFLKLLPTQRAQQGSLSDRGVPQDQNLVRSNAIRIRERHTLKHLQSATHFNIVVVF